MSPEKYYLVDGDHMHGPMSWDDLRALLESGTVSADAQWCREGETEFRPLSDLMALVAPGAAPPPVLSNVPGTTTTNVVVTLNQPARSTTAAKVQAGALATIAAAIAAPVAVVVGLIILCVFIVASVPSVSNSNRLAIMSSELKHGLSPIDVSSDVICTTVAGRLTNVTEQVVERAVITYTYYDETGAKLGNGSTWIGALRPGEVWAFKGFAGGTDTRKVQLNEIRAVR